MKKYLIGLFTVLTLLTGCATGEKALKEKGIEPMTTTQLKELYSNNTQKGQSTDGTTYIAYYRADGTMAANSQGESDTGTWEVTDEGHVCTQWVNWRSGQKKCFKNYQSENEYSYYDLQGTLGGTFTIEQGNTNNL